MRTQWYYVYISTRMSYMHDMWKIYSKNSRKRKYKLRYLDKISRNISRTDAALSTATDTADYTSR